MEPHGSLVSFFLVTLTFTASSSEWVTSWWININLLYLLPLVLCSTRAPNPVPMA